MDYYFNSFDLPCIINSYSINIMDLLKNFKKIILFYTHMPMPIQKIKQNSHIKTF